MKNSVLKRVLIAIFVIFIILLVVTGILLINIQRDIDLRDSDKYYTNNNIKSSVSETSQSVERVTLLIEPDEDPIDEVDLSDEERYIRYLSPTKNFTKVGKREKKDVFCFAGDVFFSTHIRNSYDGGGIEAILDERFRKLFNTSDINIANLECSITDDNKNPDNKTFTFAFPSKYLKGIEDLNIDLFTIANNHILDFGMEALDNTITELDKLNIGHIGAGNTLYDAKKVYIKEIDGKRYGILAASAVLPSGKWQANENHGGVFNGYEIEKVASEITLIRPYFDKIIVYMHWGNELENTSNNVQKAFAHKIVDAGADFVIGTHAHTTQEIEYYNDVPIVYSLGNFVYGGQSRDMFICEAVFDYSDDENGELHLKIYPGVSGYKSTREYDTENIKIGKLKSLSKKSPTCYITLDGDVYKDSEKDMINISTNSNQ